MKVVSTAKLKDELRDNLGAQFPEVDFLFYKSIKEAEERLPEADILLTYGEDLTERELEMSKQLKWIMVISAGLEKMPLKRIKEKGIMVTNARGIHRIPMAEYTFTVLLDSVKNARVWYKNQAESNWDRRVQMTELHGEKLAIIGPGAIGSEIARLAKAFGMTTIGVNRSGNPAPHIDRIFTIKEMNQACAEAKFVVSILPETDETRGLLDTTFFNSLLSNAVFVNIGRGKTVDQKALVEALQSNKIGHAALDVFEEEPLPADHPLWKMENVSITPHFSAITANYQPRALAIFKDNLKEFLSNGKGYTNLIDLDRGY